MPTRVSTAGISLVAMAVLLIALGSGLTACSGGGGGGDDPGGGGPPVTNPPEPDPVPLSVFETLPGVVVTITSFTGASGPGGSFQPGDFITATFTVAKDNGTPIGVVDLSSANIMVSGPTDKYQRVIVRQTDMRGRSIQNLDGSWRYTFGIAIPATYAAPLNDTPSFGLGDGELTGEPLLPGTYTLGIEASKKYSVEGTVYRDADNATADFLIGGPGTIQPREVVKDENCIACHTRVRAHGGSRVEVKLCLLCHTIGSEDRNDPQVAGGTPGVAVDFRIMIHKIHNGAHLPSVLGVATNTDGTRNYLATPEPYEVNGNSLNDFSKVNYPVWPNLSSPMPRRYGYTALTPEAKALDDSIRSGVTACEKCHGDPDGAGPITAPAQGNLSYTHPTRAACGSCHDDVDWSLPYVSNLIAMPPQPDDASCSFCHSSPGSLVDSQQGHIHPLKDPQLNGGVNVSLTSVSESGVNNADGRVQPGEKIEISFSVSEDGGAPIALSALAGLSVAISGPTTNRNLVLSGSIASAPLGAGPIYTTMVPEVVQLEFVGNSTPGIDTFATLRIPHWNAAGAETSVLVRTASGGSTVLLADAPAKQNFIEVNDTTGLAQNVYIVLDDGVVGFEEYLRVQNVQGSRVWLTAAAPIRTPHVLGASVKIVTLTPVTVGTNYTLNAGLGQITEVTEFGAGNAVVVSYTSDFVMPTIYGPTLNGSPDLGQEAGEWIGLNVVSGTYTIGVWTSRNFTVSENGETQTYRAASEPANLEFLVGSATTIDSYRIISSGGNCNACHDQVLFHGGGRRGFDTCILCHGDAGAEDRPQYVAPAAPPTTGVSIEFRNMLHKIHMGADLTNADTYTVVGFGSAPLNFTAHTYGEVHFPAFPDGVKDCRVCHGQSNTAWQEASDRSHPTQQTTPPQGWRTACSSCHDSAAAEAHFKTQTSPSGNEACAVCHGLGAEFNVDLVHKVR